MAFVGKETGLGVNGLFKGEVLSSLLIEVILTFVFVLAILGVTSKESNSSVAGIVIGLSLTLVHILGISFTGTSVNPARSFGPAVITAFDNTAAVSQLPVFIIAPLIGGVIAALVYKLVLEEEAWAEPKNPYYTYYQDPAVCDRILKEFGLEGPHCHIINGHVPVKAKKGESPIKGGGKLLVIDGGFSRAYQPTSGIAGYTLIFSSRHFRIVSHQPFTSRIDAITRNDDIANDSVIFEKMDHRVKVSETDEGRELQAQVDELKELLEAYRTGAVTENH
jgi:hypothetical protein